MQVMWHVHVCGADRADTLAHDALGVHGPRQPANRLARLPAEFESFSLRRLWQTRRFALVIGRLTLTIEKSAEESGQSSVSGDTGYRRWTNVDGERACTWALVGTAEALAGRTESRGLRPRLDEEAFWRRGGQGQVRQRGRQRGQQRQQRQVSGSGPLGGGLDGGNCTWR